jgi:hypothetical protein
MSEHRSALDVAQTGSQRQRKRAHRAVIDPDSVRYPTIQAAARHHNAWAATIYARCCKRHAGWRFAPEPALPEDLAPLPASTDAAEG